MEKKTELVERKKWRLAFPAMVIMTLIAVMTFTPDLAQAVTSTGEPLDDVYETLVGWSQGSIGKVIMIAFIIVGVVAGIARQSLLAFAIGIGAGLGVYNADSMVQAIFTAVLP